jgi:hypothetical protein
MIAAAAIIGVGAQPTQAISTSLVINEVDYDQVSVDTAEYLEIKNISAAAIELDPYKLVFVNGADNLVYRTIELPAFSLAAGDYYVVCGNAANVANCDLDVTPDTDLIQNGSPDAVALQLDATIIDTLSYEGSVPGYTEGTGTTAADSNSTANISLSRCADGVDTDNNNVDFVLVASTPGTTNACPVVGTPTPTQTATDGPSPTPTPITPTATATATVEVSCASVPDKIYELQEGGSKHNNSGTPSAPRSVVGIVTGDFQPGGNQGLEGFYMQDETGDGNPATSDGIFVFDPAPILLDVTVGQRVLVSGTTREEDGQTQLDATSITFCGTTGTISPVLVTLPIANTTDWERYEGMLITVSAADTQPLTVSETFTLARYGEVVVSSGGRLFQPTNYIQPGADAVAQQNLNNRRRLLIDDGRNNTPSNFEVPYIPTTQTEFRLGFTTPSITGVLAFDFDSYRLHPTVNIQWTNANPRQAAAPQTNSRLRVANFNLLNYFNSFTNCYSDTGTSDSNCRGADTQAEFDRQRAKTASAILGLDADIVTVSEL